MYLPQRSSPSLHAPLDPASNPGIGEGGVGNGGVGDGGGDGGKGDGGGGGYPLPPLPPPPWINLFSKSPVALTRVE